MNRPRILPAFSNEQKALAHTLLATRVAFMMGRKLEEGDWGEVYCRVKDIPHAGWSNLKLDIVNGNLGLEHKMICRRSKLDIEEACGTTIMHPSVTRSIRMPPVTTNANDVMADVLTQYTNFLNERREKVREQAPVDSEPDMRTGWLLWQDSLRQFLYFEEEVIAPNPEDYRAEWKRHEARGTRKASTNLWIYEKETGTKRYSVTNEAGAKIQPYFDVPALGTPNVYIFTVIGEVIDTGRVRIWVTESTARELRKLIGELDIDTLSRKIIKEVTRLAGRDEPAVAAQELATPLVITNEAYEALKVTLPGVSDEHSMQLLAQHLRHEITIDP